MPNKTIQHADPREQAFNNDLKYLMLSDCDNEAKTFLELKVLDFTHLPSNQSQSPSKGTPQNNL